MPVDTHEGFRSRRLLHRWHIDLTLLLGLLGLMALGMIILYSASGRDLGFLGRQVVRLGMGLVVMILIAQVPVHWLRMVSGWMYLAGVILLLLVLLVGDIGKGAQRWLDLGVLRFQPSEMMKLAMPMMIAAYFADRRLPPTVKETLLAVVLVLVPMFLIIKQPDLGTAILIGSAGVMGIFFSGLRWRIVLVTLGLLAAAAPLLWHFMHDYQRRRVLTFLNPETDPLGAGYHIIQSKIAIGSGGLYGRGWLNGSQAQLQFLPERTTDFIFAVFGEEFGFLGVLLLFGLYLFVIVRGFMIAFHAQDTFARILAATISVTFFVYFFVNVGMVSGLLPVVGVPLPLVSYGGTSMVTLLAGFGMLMAIQTERRLVIK
jgi:rod shape determining protein RodA